MNLQFGGCVFQRQTVNQLRNIASSADGRICHGCHVTSPNCNRKSSFEKQSNAFVGGRMGNENLIFFLKELEHLGGNATATMGMHDQNLIEVPGLPKVVQVKGILVILS